MLKQSGLSPLINEASQASWGKSAGAVHVSVAKRECAEAMRLIRAHFPHLAAIAEERFCPQCELTGAAKKPFQPSFVSAFFILVNVRLFGMLFCPACHRTWKPSKR